MIDWKSILFTTLFGILACAWTGLMMCIALEVVDVPIWVCFIYPFAVMAVGTAMCSITTRKEQP